MSLAQETSTASEEIPRLYKLLSREDIEEIQKLFRERQRTSGGFRYDEFRKLISHFGVVFSDDAFHNVCLKIDLDRGNIISWREFIEYLVVELQHDDDRRKAGLSIIPPMPKPANVLSAKLRSKVVRILLPKSLEEDESSGCVTVGSYGEINVWSSSWKFEMNQIVGKSC